MAITSESFMFFDMLLQPWFRGVCSAEVPEIEAEDRPSDPEGGGRRASDSNIAQHEAPFEHTDGRL